MFYLPEAFPNFKTPEKAPKDGKSTHAHRMVE